MYNQIKTRTVLLFVAATMFIFVSCNKEDNPSGGGSSAITEANLVGEWGWPSSHEMKNKTIVIKADHTGGGNLLAGGFNWKLNGKKFVAANGFYQLEMTIKSINSDKMDVEGEWQKLDSDGNVANVLNNATGTLIKTVTTQSPTLTESMVLGTWAFRASYGVEWSFTLNADHTGAYDMEPATWSISGNTLSIEHNCSTHGFMQASVKSITTSAAKVVMTVEGTRGWHLANGGDSANPFAGTLTKNL